VSVSLSALADDITTRVDQLGQREDVVSQLRSLDAVRQAVDDLLREVDEVHLVVVAARQEDFAPELPDFVDTSSALKKVASQLGKGVVDREGAQRAIDNATGKLRSVRENLTTAWRSHVAEEVPGHDGLAVLADAFRAVEGAGPHARDLHMAIDSVRSLFRAPPSPEAISQLRDLAVKVPALLQELVGENEEVRRFAHQLARGGAGVDALTPAVAEWMRSQGFTCSFKIVAGRPAESGMPT
jgi:hypothetical protein